MVNIEDVKSEIPHVEPAGINRLTTIYHRQTDLILKYLDIEEKNGQLPTRDIPVSIDSRSGQDRLKQIAWCITEEFAEYRAATEGQHQVEELMDIYHFLIELNILSDYTPSDFHKDILRYKDVNSEATDCTINIARNSEYFTDNSIQLDFIMWLGSTMNCLKLKPWKQSHHITDIDRYKFCLMKTNQLFYLIMAREYPMVDIFENYFKKSAVNQFRQQSNY